MLLFINFIFYQSEYGVVTQYAATLILDSIINQSYTGFRVLVVCVGSSVY
jgi:hypothetical protein